MGSTLDAPSLAWSPELADLPSPIRWGTPTLRVAEAPRLQIQPSDDAAAPTVVALGARRAARHRRRRRLVLVAAALPLVLAGAASAALLTPKPLRPSLAAVGSYHDTQAGFSLTYPRSWRVQHATPGAGVQLVVDTPQGPNNKLATVSVTVGADRGPLPSAADLARTVTAGLVAEYPGVQLVGTAATTLATGPAVQLQFSDPGTAPPTTMEQLAGRTADDRPLTVMVVVPNARYGPSSVDLRDFLTSIVS